MGSMGMRRLHEVRDYACISTEYLPVTAYESLHITSVIPGRGHVACREGT
jgi:hypothetical protein